jgi:gamma-glutamyltranspeptidase/glutathione hydrolase
MEPAVFSPTVIKQLSAMNYRFALQKPWGAVEAIYVDPVKKTLYGASDYRRPDGAAMGY